MSKTDDKIRGILTGVVATVAKQDDTYMRQVDVPQVVKAITPVVEHLTNNEPWYRSRVTWGAVASIVLPLLGIAGVTSDVISSEEFVSLGLAVGSAAGGLLTLYGRWKARKPLGE